MGLQQQGFQQQKKEKIQHEISDWVCKGLLDRESAALLLAQHERGNSRLIKWIGLFAILFLASSLLSFIGLLAVSISPMGSTFLLLLLALALWYKGSLLAADPEQKHAVSGSALLTLGLVGFFSSAVLIYDLAGGDNFNAVVPVLMLVTSVLALATAYKFRLRWPLLLALLLLFHAVGSNHFYGGHGSYFLSIHDKLGMALLALCTILLGRFHEERLEAGRLRHHLGFGHLYLIFGLLYLNLSLWFLSLPGGNLVWVLVFTAASILQLVAGGRLHDSRFTGFGIVFLGIDLYTRYFEHFWDDLSAGLFFLIAGLIGMLLGMVFERAAAVAAKKEAAGGAT